jgi:hypothetical protein
LLAQIEHLCVTIRGLAGFMYSVALVPADDARNVLVGLVEFELTHAPSG